MTDDLAEQIRREFGTATPEATVPEVLAALDLPARGDAREDLTARIDDDGDGVFGGLVG